MIPHRTLIDAIDALVRRDPARRGLISTEAQLGPLCPGHLAAAASHLAEHGRHVAIVTGFFVPHARPPAAETDGPPASLLLASALESLGIETTIITDRKCMTAVRAVAEASEYPLEKLVEFPQNVPSAVDDFFAARCGKTLTHLIAVERVGPSHTIESLQRQLRPGVAPRNDFESRVPVESRNRCHNMRGVVIDEHTAETYRLFDEIARHRPDAKTIGIGDGANEIGMGCVPWEELERRLEGERASRIPCRIATDWNIIAGTSNWGAYALAASVLAIRGQADVLRPLNRKQQQRVLESMVASGPAVDGVTGRQEPTVDGLPFLTYIQPWEGIRRLLGFSE